MRENGVDVTAKAPIHSICPMGIYLRCRSAWADSGSRVVGLVQKRKYMVVERLEIEVLDPL
jgi:hypothetical protein